MIYLADIGGESRTRVLVLNGRRFPRATGRCIVAPDAEVPMVGYRPAPWEIECEDMLFSLAFLLTIPESTLWDRVGEPPVAVLNRARRIATRFMF
ncbi:MAG: hypothetical protein GY708_12020 [Actinomycetia bacterium]|nr:hypothetical protein [Actinomycetes bacterium]MCP4961593.1 hypothetical protein [Actinomycetes bacterium]